MSDRFLEEAIVLARRGMRRGDGGPFGAVVVQADRVVGRGWNRVVGTPDPTAHAEIEAIRSAAAELATFDLSSCEMYATCAPCPMCLAAICWARIPVVHHACRRSDAAELGFDDQVIADELARVPGEGTLQFDEQGREAALALFEEWREKADRIQY